MDTVWIVLQPYIEKVKSMTIRKLKFQGAIYVSIRQQLEELKVHLSQSERQYMQEAGKKRR